MFCPDGYFHWGEMLEQVGYWSDTSLIADALVANERDPSLAFSTYPRALISLVPEIVDLKTFEFLLGLKRSWAVANYMQQNIPYLCSPTGAVLRGNWWTGRHADKLDWCGWQWPPNEMSEFSSYFEFFEKGSFDAQSIWLRFPCIDHELGLVKLKVNSLQLLMSALDLHGSEEESQAKRILETCFRPFEGWALCWKTEILPKTLGDALHDLGLVSDSWSYLLDSETAGSASGPQKSGVERCRDEVLSAFPDGKGSNTWSQIEDASGWSRRQINRAVLEYDEMRDWAKGGRMT